MPRGRQPSGIPTELPCGCRIRNNQRQFIYTNAVRLLDGRRVCRHGVVWVFMPNRKSFSNVGKVPVNA